MQIEDLKKILETAKTEGKGLFIERIGKYKSYEVSRGEVKSYELNDSSLSLIMDGEKTIIDITTIDSLKIE